MPRLSKIFKGELHCPNCGGVYHEATVEYRPRKELAGNMLTLKALFGPDGANWESFPEDESVIQDCLVCPGCGGVYVRGHHRIHWSIRGGRPYGKGHLGWDKMYKDYSKEIIGERRSIAMEKGRAARKKKKG